MSQKGFYKIVILVVVLVVSIAGGIIIYQYYQPLSETEYTLTSNWQTYQNEKYGFEIKYPQDWYAFNLPVSTATLLQTEKIIFSTLSQEEAKEFYVTDEGTGSSPVGVYSFAINIIHSSLEDWLKEQIRLSELFYTGFNFKTEDIILGENKAYQIDFSFNSLGPEADARAKVIPDEEKSVIYLIETMWPEECRTGKWSGECDVFNTMASSFKMP